MPRKEAKLIPFFKKALDEVKYRNLIYEDNAKKVFSLLLPHKTNRLEKEDQYILKDWYAETKRKYIFFKKYTKAKQAMIASLRKSDYVELTHFSKNKLICRILNKEEVKEKKREKKELRRKGLQDVTESDTSIESGYDSGLNSPDSCKGYEQKESNLLQNIVHDHAYIFSPPGRVSPEENNIHSEIEDVSNAVDNVAVETSGSFLPLKQNNFSGIDSNEVDTYFSDIPELQEDITLKDLYQIPSKELVTYNDHAQHAHDLNSAEANTRKKLYVCEEYVSFGETIVLNCKLFQEMDAGIADASNSIEIIWKNSVQRAIQGYSCLKSWEKVNEHYLMVFLELSSINHS